MSTGTIEISQRHEHQFDRNRTEINPFQLHLLHELQASTTNQEYRTKMIRGILFKIRGNVAEMHHLSTQPHPILILLLYVKLLLKHEQEQANDSQKG